MTSNLAGKAALVTGGGSGIGRASAQALAAEGARVLIADVAPRGGEETVEMISEAGGGAAFVKADVSKGTDVESMVGKAVETWGRLDCALNNAGFAESRVLTADLAEEDWDRVIDANLKGTWLCMKYEIRQMLEHGGGAIVNMSSVVGLVGIRQQPAYVASKHGIIGLTRAAAVEYARAGIRVNAICPAAIRTPALAWFIGENPQVEEQLVAQNPTGRLGTPEEIAAAVVWLCSDGASYVTGHALAADGGVTAQ